MGLFTNRKRDEDAGGLAEAADMLARLSPADEEGQTDRSPDDDVPFADVPFDATPVDPVPFDAIAFEGAPFGVTTFDTINEVPPAPRRRLEDRPLAQAGNVEIDAAGLLEMLGVDHGATLIDISEARQQFLADHQPVDTDDADAARIKEKIRREVNTAYASFRLTHAS